MPFTKLGDEYRDDERLQEAGAEAIALDCMARVYCTKFANGGFVSATMLPTICAAVKKAERAADRLVAAGWWKPTQGGWWIDAYSDWIPDAAAHAKAVAAAKAGADARWHGKGMPSDPLQNPDVVDSPQTQPCVVYGEEKAAHRVRLTRRWLSVLDRDAADVARDQAAALLDAILTHLAPHVVDELIGQCEVATRPPRSSNYLWKAAYEWGRERHVLLPQKMPRLSA